MNILLNKKWSVFWCLIPFVLLFIVCNANFWGFVFSHLNSFTFQSLKHCCYSFIVLPLNLLLFGLVVYLVGKQLLRLFKMETKVSLLEETVFSLGLGWAFFSYLVLVLGLTGLLYKTVFLVICFGLVIVCGREIRSIPQIFLSLKNKIRFSRFSVVEILLASILLWCIFNGFVSAIVPPTDWDTLTYHFTIPKLYLEAHRIFYIPWMLHSNWPQNIEMLYTASFLLSNDSLAQLVNWSFGLVVLLTMYAFCKQYLNNGQISLLAGTILFSQPVWSQYIGTGNVEIGWAMFLMLSAYALWKGIEGKNSNSLWLSAVFCGVVAGSKILGLVWIFIFPLVVTYYFMKNPPISSFSKGGLRWIWFKTGGFYLLIALLFTSPWYIKSFIWTNNPVWPFMYNIFDGKNWNNWLAQNYGNSNFFSFIEWKMMLANLFSPQNSNYSSFFFIVPFAATILLSLVIPSKAKESHLKNVITTPVNIFFLSMIIYAIPVFNHHEFWRFFMPVLPVCCIFWMWIVEINPPRSPFIKGGRKGILITMIIILLLPSLKINQNNKLFVLVGLQPQQGVLPQQRYLELSLDHYSLYNYINQTLPKESKILLFREIRGYYLSRNYLWGDPLNQGMIFYEGMNSADELYRKLKELKITHILVNDRLNIYKFNEKYYSDKIISLMSGVIKEYTVLVKEINQVYLYELRK